MTKPPAEHDVTSNRTDTRSGSSAAETPKSNSSGTLFQPEDTCWRVARADRVSLIVDAADYFRVLRKVFIAAQKELLLIGWDFDFELEMLPGESDEDGRAPDGFPNKMGAFIEAVLENAPDLHAYLLKWNGAVLAAPGRILPSLALDMFGNDRIHFALDGHHPFGACHHQKIVVADDSIAFCGGIDVTEDRWDTSDHLPDDPRRERKDGTLAGPWHDATSAMTGPAAKALAELSRIRWHRATEETLERPRDCDALQWPETLDTNARNVDVAIARTEPPYDGEPLINEIEKLYLRSIEAATKSIYIESQYFAAEKICAALETRLREPDGPEIVVINPLEAESQLEDEAMHVLRGRMIDRLTAADAHQGRFRIYHPANSAGEAIYVHAKIMIVDDRILRLGSSNLNDRSMGFDTECDVAVEGPAELVTGFRTRLLSEHLDVTPDVFAETLQEQGTLIAAIERLNSAEGRGLRRIVPDDETSLGNFLADSRLLDPRYLPGQTTSAGEGLRPRHLAIFAGVALVGYLGWKAWSKRRHHR
ncbi:phospholipase D-like domain-containing protein [Salipiger aestuarii]|uniref:phospholipase D-like domain-containing protein n=1 Tax=Salipiger aestuarii TaxID=568098 RepID=UPI001CC2D1C7|nr:phospholipase D-like domain-containing protein [Salipiger aestuarii]